MAAYDIQKHFKALRVDTGRRRGRDPFATGFEDDSEGEATQRKSRAKTKAGAPPVEKAIASALPTKTNVASPFSTIDAFQDSDDEFLGPAKRTDRRPSPAPARLALSRVTDGAGRRGSLDQGLQPPQNRPPRSAVALAAGSLAYLDDSDDEDSYEPAKRADRDPSPAPARKHSNSLDSGERSFTPRGDRSAPTKEQSQTRLQPSRHTVASPFAGTKYLEDSDSDSDEEAVASRTGSIESASIEAAETVGPLDSPSKKHLEVRRVDKSKQNGSGVSWRAFSDSRNQQRSAEIEALQTSLRQRGKSISFCSHAFTDDGKRVPVPSSPEHTSAGGAARGRRASRRKSPPRRAEDTKSPEEEPGSAGGGGGGEEGRPDRLIYDPTQYKTNPFTGEPIRRTFSDADSSDDVKQPPSATSPVPDIRVDDIGRS